MRVRSVTAQLLRHDLRTYVRYAIEVGWPAMEQGKDLPDTMSAERLSRDVHHTPVHDLREAAVFGHMLERTSEALLDRDARITEDASGLTSVMWITVFAGGFITIAFSYLFGFARSVMQTVMIGTLALLIGLVLFLTMSLDYPFRGAIRVGPDAFERALSNFNQIDTASVAPKVILSSPATQRVRAGRCKVSALFSSTGSREMPLLCNSWSMFWICARWDSPEALAPPKLPASSTPINKRNLSTYARDA